MADEEALVPPPLPSADDDAPPAPTPAPGAIAPPAVPAAGAGAGAGAGAATPAAADNLFGDAEAAVTDAPTDDAFWEEQKAWSAAVSAEMLDIQVNDPQTISTGFMSSTQTYAVVTAPTGTTVRRRYSDFAWLRAMLSMRYTGVLLPCLPEKKFIGGSSAEFIQTRMRALGIFLTRIAANPFLKKDNTLQAFLTIAETGAWETKKKSTTAPGTDTNEGLTRWKECLRRYSIPENAEAKLATVKQQLDTMETAFALLMRSTQRLAIAAQAFCTEVEAFKTDYEALAKLQTPGGDTPDPSADLGAVVSSTSKGITHWGKILSLQPLMVTAILHDTVRFESGQIAALKEVLRQRDANVLEAKRANASLQKQQVALDALEIQGKTAKIDKQKKVVEQETATARECDRVVESLTKGLFFSEIDRFSTEKVLMLKEMWGQFAATGGAYSSKLGKLWTTLLKGLQLNAEDMVKKAKKSMSSAKALVKVTTGEDKK